MTTPDRAKLNDLFDMGERMARASMEKLGRVEGCFLALTGKGETATCPALWRDEDEKVAILKALKVLFRDQDVVAYVAFSEVWMATAKAGDTRMPSERDDRTEGLFITLCVKGVEHPEVRQFTIDRPFDGSPPTLIPAPLIDGATVGGRLTTLLDD